MDFIYRNIRILILLTYLLVIPFSLISAQTTSGTNATNTNGTCSYPLYIDQITCQDNGDNWTASGGSTPVTSTPVTAAPVTSTNTNGSCSDPLIVDQATCQSNGYNWTAGGSTVVTPVTAPVITGGTTQPPVTGGTTTPPSGSVGITNPLGVNNTQTLPDLITKVLQAAIKIGIPICALAIIYCGFLFVFARGNSEKLTKAKDALLYTLIGVAILLGALAIANMISSTVTAL